jgi:ParB/RepB/Spo0J family partition protein
MTQVDAVELQQISLDLLDAHPANPRLMMREDVIADIVREVARDGFRPEHALLVVPSGDRFLILSGHHRAEAARRADLPSVPAWVRDGMDEDEQFFALVTANAQGELSPLEIGMHALAYVTPSQGKTGGGITAYANRIGKSQPHLSELRSAASVVTALHRSSDEVRVLLDKAKHLTEISRAPEPFWPWLVRWMLDRQATVVDVRAKVAEIQAFNGTIPDAFAGWLPYQQIVERALNGSRPSASQVKQIVRLAQQTYEWIAANEPEARDAFTDWLHGHAGKESWDPKKIQGYWQQLISDQFMRTEERDKIRKLREACDLRVGDFRDVLADVEAGSVDLILTDPPYPREFLPLFADLSKVAARLLKPGGLAAVMVGQSYLPEVYGLLGEALDYHWTIAYLTPGGQAVQLWNRDVQAFWKPVLLYSNGPYAGGWIGDVAQSNVNDNDKRFHEWGQSASGMVDLLDRLSKPNDLICDPFAGGGTTPLVALGRGRRFIGAELEESVHELAWNRLVASL